MLLGWGLSCSVAWAGPPHILNVSSGQILGWKGDSTSSPLDYSFQGLRCELLVEADDSSRTKKGASPSEYRPELRIENDSEHSVQLTVRQNSSRVTLQYSGEPAGNPSNVKVILRVPSPYLGNLYVNSLSGDVTVFSANESQPSRGWVRIRAGEGNIWTEGLSARFVTWLEASGQGRINVHLGYGALLGRTQSGSLGVLSREGHRIRLSSQEGPIDAEQNRGTLEVESESGPVRVVQHRAGDVRVRTSSGELLLSNPWAFSETIEGVNGSSLGDLIPCNLLVPGSVRIGAQGG